VREDGGVSLVDFEYGGANYRGFDLATHLSHWAGGAVDGRYDDAKFPGVDDEARRRFVAAYREVTGAADVDGEIARCLPLAHAVWGLWAVCALPDAEEGPFSHIEYAERRIDACLRSMRPAFDDAPLAPGLDDVVMLDASLEDLAECSVLLVQSFFEGPSRHPTFLAVTAHREHRRLKEHHGRHVQIVAKSARTGDAVGYVDLQETDNTDLDRPSPYISDLAVRPGHRRRGLASRLVEACEARARARGHDAVYLKVEETNAAAQRMYEKLGYEIMVQTRRPPVSWAPTKAKPLVMRKRLCADEPGGKVEEFAFAGGGKRLNQADSVADGILNGAIALGGTIVALTTLLNICGYGWIVEDGGIRFDSISELQMRDTLGGGIR